MVLKSLGNAQTGYELGSSNTEVIYSAVDIGSTVIDISNFNKAVLHFCSNGSASGSVSFSIDGTNFIVGSVFELSAGAGASSTLNNNLLAYYTFDDGTASDLVGSDDGTIAGGAFATENGKLGSAIIFEGAEDRIEFGANLHVQAKTVNMWVKRNSAAGDTFQMIWSAHSISNGDAKIQTHRDTGSLVVRIATDGGEKELTTGSKTTDNDWSMVTLRHDDTNNLLYAYIDAVNVGSRDTGAVSHTAQVGEVAKIGGWHSHNDNDFNGSIDEVGFWSSTLSEAEITELYNSGTGKTYPFVGTGGGGMSQQLVGFAGSSMYRFMKVEIGSDVNGSFAGTATVTLFAK